LFFVFLFFFSLIKEGGKCESPPVVNPGIAPKQMMGRFRGEAIYSAEVDVHFPQLTVGDTLAFAAEARAVSDVQHLGVVPKCVQRWDDGVS